MSALAGSLRFWFADFFFVVDGIEEKAGEGVVAEVSVAFYGTVPIGAPGEPKFQGFRFETDGAVFDDLVVAQKMNLGNRLQYVRLHRDDL